MHRSTQMLTLENIKSPQSSIVGTQPNTAKSLSNQSPTRYSQRENDQILLTLVEKNQQLAQESENKLKIREQEHENRLQEMKLTHAQELQKLQCQLKIFQEVKKREGKIKKENINVGTEAYILKQKNIMDKVRALLIEEIEKINILGQEREKRLKEENLMLKHRQAEVEKIVLQIQSEGHQKKLQLQERIKELTGQIQHYETLLVQSRQETENEVKKYHIQIQQLEKQIISTKDEKEQLIVGNKEKILQESYEDLLQDFKGLQSVLTQHDENTQEVMKYLKEEKVRSETFYSDKVKHLENKNMRLENKLKVQFSEYENKIHNLLFELQQVKQNKEQQQNNYQQREEHYSKAIDQRMNDILNKFVDDHAKEEQLLTDLKDLQQKMSYQISYESKPNYEQAEQVIATLQKENQILRTQVDTLHNVIKNGQSPESQSLVRLKEQIQFAIQQFRTYIVDYDREKGSWISTFENLEEKIRLIDDNHTKKEMESAETINSLTDLVQQQKFQIRKLESDQIRSKYDELKKKYEIVEQENTNMKQSQQKVNEQLQKIEKEVQKQSNKQLSLDFEQYMNVIQELIIKQKLDNNLQQISKIEQVTNQVKDKSERFDELLIKHCRLIQRTKAEESEQLITWQHRQEVFNTAIRELKDKILIMNQKENNDSRYQDMVKFVQESLFIEQNLLKNYNTELELEYQRQIKVLDTEVENLLLQKSNLIKLVQEYEHHYTDSTKERTNQCQTLMDLNNKLEQKTKGGSYMQIVEKFQRLITSNQEFLKENIKNIIHVIEQNNQINQNQNSNLLEKIKTEKDSHINELMIKIEEQQQDIVFNSTQIRDLQSQIRFLEHTNQQQKVEYLTMQNLFEKQFKRVENKNISNDPSFKDIDIQLCKLEKAKKITEINQVVRDLKQIFVDLKTDIKIDKKYAQYIKDERDIRLLNDLESVIKQRDKLLVHIQLQQTDSQESIYKEIISKEKERISRLEYENERLIEILSGNSRYKQKEFKEILNKRMSPEKQSMLMAAASGILLNNTTHYSQYMTMIQPLGNLTNRNISVLNTTAGALSQNGTKTPRSTAKKRQKSNGTTLIEGRSDWK